MVQFSCCLPFDIESLNYEPFVILCKLEKNVCRQKKVVSPGKCLHNMTQIKIQMVHVVAGVSFMLVDKSSYFLRLELRLNCCRTNRE